MEMGRNRMQRQCKKIGFGRVTLTSNCVGGALASPYECRRVQLANGTLGATDEKKPKENKPTLGKNRNMQIYALPIVHIAGLTWICLGHSSSCQLRCEKRRGTIKSILSSGYNARTSAKMKRTIVTVVQILLLLAGEILGLDVNRRGREISRDRWKNYGKVPHKRRLIYGSINFHNIENNMNSDVLRKRYFYENDGKNDDFSRVRKIKNIIYKYHLKLNKYSLGGYKNDINMFRNKTKDIILYRYNFAKKYYILIVNRLKDDMNIYYDKPTGAASTFWGLAEVNIVTAEQRRVHINVISDTSSHQYPGTHTCKILGTLVLLQLFLIYLRLIFQNNLSFLRKWTDEQFFNKEEILKNIKEDRKMDFYVNLLNHYSFLKRLYLGNNKIYGVALHFHRYKYILDIISPINSLFYIYIAHSIYFYLNNLSFAGIYVSSFSLGLLFLKLLSNKIDMYFLTKE
ncbi:conserved Plasmodium protein, unknown function [Plasmodium ovale curtisi]|uniref:Uncharacterized protein n=1 Tax=Plasmodium ovale curtisi TaxID=864141 RepID=A0A1A8VTT4_PLAOA|nr:conserved Plasmodium protein, unknown function [Plasmodium ovale curtisi]